MLFESLIPLLQQTGLQQTWLLTLLALLFERLAAWPLQGLIGHPVQWIGFVIERLEQKLNRDLFAEKSHRVNNIYRFSVGTLVSLFVILISIGFTLLIIALSHFLATEIGLFGWLPLFLLMTSLFAAGSLRQYVFAVYTPLSKHNLIEARHATAQIVGRNTQTLDEQGLSKASLESLAENTCDGVFAPLFWCLCLGPLGLVVYKTINTLDSMIAYRSDRYEFFGKFAARLDDLANYFPARLTAILFLMTNKSDFINKFRSVGRDAIQQISPNAGWPEAAMAVTLNIELGGAKRYANGLSSIIKINDGAKSANCNSLRRGLRAYDQAICLTMFICLSLYLGLAVMPIGISQ